PNSTNVLLARMPLPPKTCTFWAGVGRAKQRAARAVERRGRRILILGTRRRNTPIAGLARRRVRRGRLYATRGHWSHGFWRSTATAKLGGPDLDSGGSFLFGVPWPKLVPSRCAATVVRHCASQLVRVPRSTTPDSHQPCPTPRTQPRLPNPRAT